MTTFILDLWQDLKQKRLWPVAVVLVTAIAGVPLVLSKSSAETGGPSVLPGDQAAVPGELPLVDLESVPASSRLETFSPSNPFTPEKDVAKADTGPDGDSGSGGGGAGGAGGGAGGSVSDDLTGASGGDSGSTGGSGDSGSSGGGTKWFTFEIDVTFGAVGDEQRMKDVKTLQVLPDENNPVIVFMGMKDDMKTALFMVLDPNVEASGEGKCAPDPDHCSFIELRTSDGSNEMFLNSSRGEDYSLRLDKVQRVVTDEPPEEQDAKQASASSRERDESPEPFFLPRLLERISAE